METHPKHPQTAALFTALLAALDISASKLAKAISTPGEEYSQQVISNYVAGKFKPGQELLGAIARRYPAIDAKWLLTGEGEPFPSGRYNEKPTPAPLPETLVEKPTDPPTSPAGAALRVNRDEEGTDYWRGLALERLDTIDFYKELLRGAYGIRPADDEEQPAEGQRKKEPASSNAADLKKTVDEIAQKYQYRIVAHSVGFVPAWMSEELETA